MSDKKDDKKPEVKDLSPKKDAKGGSAKQAAGGSIQSGGNIQSGGGMAQGTSQSRLSNASGKVSES